MPERRWWSRLRAWWLREGRDWSLDDEMRLRYEAAPCPCGIPGCVWGHGA